MKERDAAWKEVLGTRNKDAKDRILRFKRKKRERLKGVYLRAKMR